MTDLDSVTSWFCSIALLRFENAYGASNADLFVLPLVYLLKGSGWIAWCLIRFGVPLANPGVRNCSDALLNVQDFLGRFLVKEFDHEAQAAPTAQVETHTY